MSIRRLVALAVVLVCVSGCRPKSAEERAEWMADKISDELDLDDVQKAKLDVVKKAYVESRAKRKSEREKGFDELRGFIVAEKFETAKAKDMMARVQKGNAEDLDLLLPKIADFHSSLKPEQKQKAGKLFDKAREYFAP